LICFVTDVTDALSPPFATSAVVEMKTKNKKESSGKGDDQGIF